jgi:5-hydroxyisourate hydrolase-like protein (transthyretin family)
MAGDFTLHVWLEDSAGNQREAGAVASVPLRFDPDPPEVGFLAPDATDPLRVALKATDRHSGLASGEIEMRAIGTRTWHGLRTERQGSQLVAHVDDERFTKGTYEFRGHAVDRAGNEASTGKRTDGSAASIRLPARIDTRLAVGMSRRSRRTRPRFDATVLATFGSRLRLTGLLTNADGQPIDGATIEAFGKRDNFAIGLATTGANGRFRYILRASRNRDLVFRYGGSRRIGAAIARFHLRVRAASSIRTSRHQLRNGQQVTFTGRVRSRPLPASGKLIEIQAYFRGRWRTISTVRTDHRGRWRFPYRFGATLGRVTYRFRAQMPVEGGYPFAAGHSRVARVVVTGP